LQPQIANHLAAQLNGVNVILIIRMQTNRNEAMTAGSSAL